MALHDYAELDESDFYGQGFEMNGVVSLWAGILDRSHDSENLDILQDLCGIGYYNLDNQEINSEDFKLTLFEKLIFELSYPESFRNAAVQAATHAGFSNARYVLAQYDFAYDPKRVKREIHADPVFIGAFPYVVS